MYCDYSWCVYVRKRKPTYAGCCGGGQLIFVAIDHVLALLAKSLKASVIAQNLCVGCEDFVGSVLVAPIAPVGFHFPYRHFVACCSSGQSLQTTRIGN